MLTSDVKQNRREREKGKKESETTKDHMNRTVEKERRQEGEPAGPKPGAWQKTRLVGERESQLYAPHGAERTNY